MIDSLNCVAFLLVTVCWQSKREVAYIEIKARHENCLKASISEDTEPSELPKPPEPTLPSEAL